MISASKSSVCDENSWTWTCKSPIKVVLQLSLHAHRLSSEYAVALAELLAGVGTNLKLSC